MGWSPDPAKKNSEMVLNQFSKTVHVSSLLFKNLGGKQGKFMLHDNQQLVLKYRGDYFTGLFS